LAACGAKVPGFKVRDICDSYKDGAISFDEFCKVSNFHFLVLFAFNIIFLFNIVLARFVVMCSEFVIEANLKTGRFI